MQKQYKALALSFVCTTSCACAAEPKDAYSILGCGDCCFGGGEKQKCHCVEIVVRVGDREVVGIFWSPPLRRAL